jgi:hypothetical protein
VTEKEDPSSSGLSQSHIHGSVDALGTHILQEPNLDSVAGKSLYIVAAFRKRIHDDHLPIRKALLINTLQAACEAINAWIICRDNDAEEWGMHHFKGSE